MLANARLFNCARCHCQVVICRACDCGQRYCAQGCAALARRDSQQRAQRKYRRNYPGRCCNVLRQARYRVRQREKVTHPGSVGVLATAVLRHEAVRSAVVAIEPRHNDADDLPVCHFCHCGCDRFLRYHFVEPWGVHTIASQLGVHHSTVDRVLSQAGMPKVTRARGSSIIDPYLPFIRDLLERHPRLTAARLYAMVSQRGYPGGPSHFRACIAQLRPRPPAAAYLRLKTLPGEQAQVDWGHFGQVQIGRARRPLMAFVMVLSWSRQIFLRFYLNQRMENFLRGHVAAFSAFAGVPNLA